VDSVGTHPRNGVLNKRKEKKITKTRPVDFVGIIHLSSASCVCVCVCRCVCVCVYVCEHINTQTSPFVCVCMCEHINTHTSPFFLARGTAIWPTPSPPRAPHGAAALLTSLVACPPSMAHCVSSSPLGLGSFRSGTLNWGAGLGGVKRGKIDSKHGDGAPAAATSAHGSRHAIHGLTLLEE
jgi:hypothetical protein